MTIPCPRHRTKLVLSVLMLLLCSPRAWAEDNEPSPVDTPIEAAADRQEEPEETDRWTAQLGGDRRLRFGLGKPLYPDQVADPQRPTISLTHMSISDSEILDSGASRWNIRMGSRFSFLRLFDEAHPERGWELDAEIGYLGQFDIDSSLDNIGWDGFYGFHLNWRPVDSYVLRLGIDHQSAHLGDEYIAKTGRQRLEYTRQEVVLGASVDLSGSWRIYLEGGHSYSNRSALQADLRLQGGVEFEKRDAWLSRRATPYIALDVSAYEENNWEVNHNLQTGLAFYMPDSRGSLRLGAEWYRGRSTMGEFFLEDEEYVSLGIWIDI